MPWVYSRSPLAVTTYALHAALVGLLLVSFTSCEAQKADTKTDAKTDTKADAKTDAVADGIKALASTDAAARGKAARDLGALGAKAAAATPALVKALGDEQASVRAYAAYALGEIGDKATPTVDALAACAIDGEKTVRRAALVALRKLDLPRSVSLPLFVRSLSHADPAHLHEALHTMAEYGADAVPFLSDCLKNKDAAYWACLVLAEIGPAAKDAVPNLTEVLGHDEPEVRLQAAVALGEIGGDAKASLPALTKILQSDPSDGVRYAAAYSIGKIGVRDAAVEEALVASTANPDKFLQAISAWALARIAPDDEAHVERAVTLLVAGLKSDDSHLRRAAARGLGELTVKGDAILPALLAALGDSDPTVAGNVLDALASRGAAAVPRLNEALESPAARVYAARIAGRIGSEASAVVPALVKALGGAEGEFRRELQFALGAMGPAAAPAVSELLKSLDSSDETIRNSALFALGRIGPAAKEAAPKLETLSKGDDSFVRLASLWALVQIEPTDAKLIERAVPEMVKGLDDDRELLRVEVASALGRLGPAAKSALTALKQHANDDSPFARRAIGRAIEQIEGK